MGITRRNTIIGLGALAGGTGVLAGSGAFTAVEAQRSVSINTSGDENALLRIRVNDEDYAGIADGGNDTIVLNVENLNLNARTRFDAALEIEPTADSDQGPWAIDILDDFEGSSLVGGSGVVQFQVNDDAGVGDPSEVEPGETVAYDLVIDLIGLSSESAVNDDVESLLGDPASIVIEAIEN